MLAEESLNDAKAIASRVVLCGNRSRKYLSHDGSEVCYVADILVV